MDRSIFGYGEVVTADTTSPGTNDDKMNRVFDRIEDSMNERQLDIHPFGIVSGLTVVENGTPNMTVKVNSGVAQDQNGARIEIPSQQTVDPLTDYLGNVIALPGVGNEKYVSVYVKFARLEQEVTQDLNSVQYYESELEYFELRVRAGADAAVGMAVPPGLQGEEILLADILLYNGMTAITTAGDIETTRTQNAWKLSPANTGPKTVNVGTAKEASEAILSHLNDLVDGTVPLTTDVITHTNDTETFAGGNLPPPTGDLETWLRTLITYLGATTGTTGGLRIGNGSLGTWADGSSAGAAQAIGAQLIAVVSALSGTAGTAKMGGSAIAQSPTSISADTLLVQLTALLTAINARARIASAETISGNWTITGSWLWDAAIAFLTTHATPQIKQDIQAGTGANDGYDLAIRAQPGQAQTGGADNNNGGDIVRYPGSPGTGGSGNAGVYGDDVVQFNDKHYVRYREISALPATTTQTICSIPTATGGVYTITVRCQNKNSDGTGGSHIVHVTFRNIAGTATQQGSETAAHTGNNNTGAAVTFSVSGANAQVDVTAGSAGATTTDFNVFVEVSEFTP